MNFVAILMIFKSLTDENIKKIDEITKDKEKEILEV